MDFLNLGILQYVVFGLMIGSLILFHELGHFLVARWTGVRVEEFGLGFPPRLVTLFQSGGTKFTLNLIPLGGFVRPAGEDDPRVPGGLAAASKRVRFAVIVAGALTNFIIAFAVFVFGFMLGRPDRIALELVVEGTPAAEAGLQPGDVILEADSQAIHYNFQLSQIVRAHLGDPLPLRLLRDGQEFTLLVTPRTEWPDDQGPLGVELSAEPLVVRYGFVPALDRAVEEMVIQIHEIATLPGRIFSGQIPLEAARPIGLVGLKQITDQAVEYARDTNRWYPIINWMAMISLALGLSNLLPLPALDGGRLLFIVIEAVRGRRIPPEREGQAHLIGFVVLLALMVLINYYDVVNPVIAR